MTVPSPLPAAANSVLNWAQYPLLSFIYVRLFICSIIGSDLLVSLTSTFDAKLRSLLSGSGGSNDSSSNSTGGTEASPVNHTTPPALFRDPSLHRAFDHKQTYDTTNKEVADMNCRDVMHVLCTC